MAMDIWMFVGKIEAFEEEGADRVLDRLEGVGIDSIDPQSPLWRTSPGERIQGFMELEGSVSELDLEVFLYRDDSEIPVRA